MLQRSTRRAASALVRELHLQPVASTSISATLRSADRKCASSRSSLHPRTPCTTLQPRRCLSSSAARKLATPVDEVPEGEDPFDLAKVERVSDQVDVCIVGGGPAGLSAAIRIMQLAKEQGKDDFRVIVLEKGGEVGAHILSGAVIEPTALNELIPDWKDKGAPLNQEATSDTMRYLTSTGSIPMPHPPQMNNKGNYIISLSKFTRWLSEQAEELGVEIYPGFAGANLLYTSDGTGVRGVVTNEIGLDKSYQPKEQFEPGMEFHAKVTLIAEGAHGSLSLKAQKKFNLREGKDPQTYGLGIKEVWRVPEEQFKPGKVVHTLGWPLDRNTYGGSWLYHLEDRMVSLGLVIGLDYGNPHLSPYREFQRMKHHPFFSQVLKGGECLAYGARVLNEGGYQSIPKLTFPGGALIGCSAGFLNVPKIKGTHTAMKSGMLAAEAAFQAIVANPEAEAGAEDAPGMDISSYQTAIDDSWVMKELKEVRNLRPSFHNPLGMWGGIAYSGLDSLFLKGRVPWTFHHPGEDHAQTKRAKQTKPIDYPAPDGELSFDILTSVARTGTNHAENQPVHLYVKDGDYARHTKENAEPFAGLLQKACPASVYEYVDTASEGGEEHADGKRFVINSQNCIHCK